MKLQKTAFADLKTLIAEAESTKAFLTTKKYKDETITDLILRMIVKEQAETFEFQSKSGKSVGFAVLLYSDTQLSIGPIYISKESRGKGYSTILLKEIETIAKEKELATIFAKTWGGNKASKHLFTTYGFIQTKEVLDLRVDGDSTVSYEYQIPL